MTYRIAEFGVERIEYGQSTFIHADRGLPAWREYEAWRALGHEPAAPSERPRFIEPEPRPEPKRLWIIGAGGYGREVFGLAQSAHGSGDEWAVAGFLNDIPDALDKFPNYPRIGGDTDYQPELDDVFVCAVGEISGRQLLCQKFKLRRARFINLIQRSAMVSLSVELGEGIIVEALAGIGANARIGDFTTVLSHANIGHDSVVGAYVQVAPFASILGRAEIGDEVLIGSHAVVLPDVKIGAGAKIGAGSVVVRDVPAGATMFGVPATRIH
jgi:sugar O-acyltransferase (sialic acid O-acetyltransferase NeuD family)